MVMGEQATPMTPFCTRIRVCIRRRASESERQVKLTKTLPAQQTGCWVQELPEPVPPTVIGEHESPTWPLVEGAGSPRYPKISVMKVEEDCYKRTPQYFQVTGIKKILTE